MIKFLHLLSVIVFCTINVIECSNSIHDELRNYYDSSSQQQFIEEWKKYRHAFENEIASGLRENFGTRAVNIYEPDKRNAHLIAQGFQLTDGVVMVYFDAMELRELPALLRPKITMDLPSNFVKFESKLGRMFIDTTYTVARNSSSIIYARPEDQGVLSPFSLQQVDTTGKVVIIAEDCFLSGSAVATLSGDSVTLGHSPFLLTDCKLVVEISTPNSGAAPVIAPYFPPGPRKVIEMIMATPIREELQTKLQGAMYSYVNTSVLFGNQSVEFRNNQQKLFKSYAVFITDYVAELNRKTIQLNKGHAKIPDYEVSMDKDADKSRLPCQVALREMVLYGLDTAYVTRAGGPLNDGSAHAAADAILFSSMQIRGKMHHDDSNGSSTKEFAVELTDVALIVGIVIEEEETKLQQINFTGWRSLEFSIIPRDTANKDRHEHQALVYGHILNELPALVLKHVARVLHGPIDENKLVGGGGSGSNGSGGGSGGGGGNDGTDDNGGVNGRGNSEGGANKEYVTKTDVKTEGFFSDDILDDNFFSDDKLLSDDVLDKNFFNESREMIDKNFFSENQDNTPDGGNGDDDFVKTTTDSATGSYDYDYSTKGGDGGGVNNDVIDTGGVESDDEKIAGADDLENANAPDVKNGDVDEDGKFPMKITVPTFHSDSVDKNEREHVGDDDKEHVKANLQNDFLSDGFIETEFFSDDGFEDSKQGDATGNPNTLNDNDQNDLADGGIDEPDFNSGNAEQVDENERNSDGNKGKDKDYPIHNAENGNEESGSNEGRQVDIIGKNIGSNENKSADGVDFSYDDKPFFSDDNKPFFTDDEKPFFSDDDKPFFSNDEKPFFSDDLIETDFFSDDDFGGKKQGDVSGKVKGNNDNDKDQIDNADDGYDEQDINSGNVGQVDENESNIESHMVEGADDNTPDNGEQLGVHETNIGSSEKKTLSDAASSYFSDKNNQYYSGNNNNYFTKTKATFSTGGIKQHETDPDNRKPVSNHNKPFMSDENKKGDKTKMPDKEGDNEQDEGFFVDNKPFFSDDNKPFLSDDVLDKEFLSDEKTKMKAKTGDGKLNADFSDDSKPFLSDDVLDKEFLSEEKMKAKTGDKKLNADFSDDSKPFFSDNDKPFMSDDNLFSDDNKKGEKTKLKNKAGSNKKNTGFIETNKPSLFDDKKPFFSDENKSFLSDKNIKGGKTKLKAKSDSAESMKSGEGFLNEHMFSDMDIERRDSSRRHVPQDNDTVNVLKEPKNRDGDYINDDDRRKKQKTLIGKQNTVKVSSKENISESTGHSREGKKVVLPSNVHNTRRHQNVHTSENEIR